MRKSLKMRAFATACAFLAAAAATPATAATSIDTTGTHGGDVYEFGQPNTSAYGETFTVGADNVLNGFSLYLTSTPQVSPLNFTAYIYAWNGSSAAGSALYTSSAQSFAGSATPTEFSFNTGNLALGSGQQYVAFLFANSGGVVGMPFPSGDAYSGGTFVFNNAGTDFASLTSGGWSTFGNNDVWFKALFNVSAVPEPGTWALMLLGFGAIGIATRRDRKKLRSAAA